MDNRFICSMCERDFEKARSDAEAQTEAEARHGRANLEAGAAVVCDDCLNWMLDIESICRDLARQVGDDPDAIVSAPDGERVPLWVSFISAGKQRTRLPSPDELRRQA